MKLEKLQIVVLLILEIGRCNILSASDSPVLMKILQAVDEAKSDEHLFEVTLELLRSICACMRETLKEKEENVVFNGASNLFLSDERTKVLDIYKKIYNNTCFSLRKQLINKLQKSKEVDDYNDHNIEINCAYRRKNYEPGNNYRKNDFTSDLERILFKTFIETRDLHKYTINKNDLFQKSKTVRNNMSKPKVVVIITLSSKLNDKYNHESETVKKEDFLEIVHSNCNVDIDLYNTIYFDDDLDPNNKIKDVENCNLDSIYTYLMEMEKRKQINIVKVLNKKQSIKIYIDITGSSTQGNLLNICCKDETQHDKKENNNSQKTHNDDTLHTEYKETISNIKHLLKLYSNKLKNDEKYSTKEKNFVNGTDSCFMAVTELSDRDNINAQETSSTIKYQPPTSVNRSVINDERSTATRYPKENQRRVSSNALNSNMNSYGLLPLDLVLQSQIKDIGENNLSAIDSLDENDWMNHKGITMKTITKLKTQNNITDQRINISTQLERPKDIKIWNNHYKAKLSPHYVITFSQLIDDESNISINDAKMINMIRFNKSLSVQKENIETNVLEPPTNEISSSPPENKQIDIDNAFKAIMTSAPTVTSKSSRRTTIKEIPSLSRGLEALNTEIPHYFKIGKTSRDMTTAKIAQTITFKDELPNVSKTIDILPIYQSRIKLQKDEPQMIYLTKTTVPRAKSKSTTENPITFRSLKTRKNEILSMNLTENRLLTENNKNDMIITSTATDNANNSISVKSNGTPSHATTIIFENVNENIYSKSNTTKNQLHSWSKKYPTQNNKEINMNSIKDFTAKSITESLKYNNNETLDQFTTRVSSSMPDAIFKSTKASQKIISNINYHQAENNTLRSVPISSLSVSTSVSSNPFKVTTLNPSTLNIKPILKSNVTSTATKTILATPTKKVIAHTNYLQAVKNVTKNPIRSVITSNSDSTKHFTVSDLHSTLKENLIHSYGSEMETLFPTIKAQWGFTDDRITTEPLLLKGKSRINEARMSLISNATVQSKSLKVDASYGKKIKSVAIEEADKLQTLSTTSRNKATSIFGDIFMIPFSIESSTINSFKLTDQWMENTKFASKYISAATTQKSESVTVTPNPTTASTSQRNLNSIQPELGLFSPDIKVKLNTMNSETPVMLNTTQMEPNLISNEITTKSGVIKIPIKWIGVHAKTTNAVKSTTSMPVTSIVPKIMPTKTKEILLKKSLLNNISLRPRDKKEEEIIFIAPAKQHFFQEKGQFTDILDSSTAMLLFPKFSEYSKETTRGLTLSKKKKDQVKKQNLISSESKTSDKTPLLSTRTEFSSKLNHNSYTPKTIHLIKNGDTELRESNYYNPLLDFIVDQKGRLARTLPFNGNLKYIKKAISNIEKNIISNMTMHKDNIGNYSEMHKGSSNSEVIPNISVETITKTKSSSKTKEELATTLEIETFKSDISNSTPVMIESFTSSLQTKDAFLEKRKNKSQPTSGTFSNTIVNFTNNVTSDHSQIMIPVLVKSFSTKSPITNYILGKTSSSKSRNVSENPADSIYYIVNNAIIKPKPSREIAKKDSKKQASKLLHYNLEELSPTVSIALKPSQSTATPILSFKLAANSRRILHEFDGSLKHRITQPISNSSEIRMTSSVITSTTENDTRMHKVISGKLQLLSKTSNLKKLANSIYGKEKTARRTDYSNRIFSSISSLNTHTTSNILEHGRKSLKRMLDILPITEKTGPSSLSLTKRTEISATTQISPLISKLRYDANLAAVTSAASHISEKPFIWWTTHSMKKISINIESKLPYSLPVTHNIAEKYRSIINTDKIHKLDSPKTTRLSEKITSIHATRILKQSHTTDKFSQPTANHITKKYPSLKSNDVVEYFPNNISVTSATYYSKQNITASGHYLNKIHIIEKPLSSVTTDVAKTILDATTRTTVDFSSILVTDVNNNRSTTSHSTENSNFRKMYIASDTPNMTNHVTEIALDVNRIHTPKKVLNITAIRSSDLHSLSNRSRINAKLLIPKTKVITNELKISMSKNITVKPIASSTYYGIDMTTRSAKNHVKKLWSSFLTRPPTSVTKIRITKKPEKNIISRYTNKKTSLTTQTNRKISYNLKNTFKNEETAPQYIAKLFQTTASAKNDKLSSETPGTNKPYIGIHGNYIAEYPPIIAASNIEILQTTPVSFITKVISTSNGSLLASSISNINKSKLLTPVTNILTTHTYQQTSPISISSSNIIINNSTNLLNLEPTKITSLIPEKPIILTELLTSSDADKNTHVSLNSIKDIHLTYRSITTPVSTRKSERNITKTSKLTISNNSVTNPSLTINSTRSKNITQTLTRMANQNKVKIRKPIIATISSHINTSTYTASSITEKKKPTLKAVTRTISVTDQHTDKFYDKNIHTITSSIANSIKGKHLTPDSVQLLTTLNAVSTIQIPIIINNNISSITIATTDNLSGTRENVTKEPGILLKTKLISIAMHAANKTSVIATNIKLSTMVEQNRKQPDSFTLLTTPLTSAIGDRNIKHLERFVKPWFETTMLAPIAKADLKLNHHKRFTMNGGLNMPSLTTMSIPITLTSTGLKLDRTALFTTNDHLKNYSTVPFTTNRDLSMSSLATISTPITPTTTDLNKEIPTRLTTWNDVDMISFTPMKTLIIPGRGDTNVKHHRIFTETSDVNMNPLNTMSKTKTFATTGLKLENSAQFITNNAFNIKSLLKMTNPTTSIMGFKNIDQPGLFIKNNGVNMSFLTTMFSSNTPTTTRLKLEHPARFTTNGNIKINSITKMTTPMTPPMRNRNKKPLERFTTKGDLNMNTQTIKWALVAPTTIRRKLKHHSKTGDVNVNSLTTMISKLTPRLKNPSSIPVFIRHVTPTVVTKVMKSKASDQTIEKLGRLPVYNNVNTIGISSKHPVISNRSQILLTNQLTKNPAQLSNYMVTMTPNSIIVDLRENAPTEVNTLLEPTKVDLNINHLKRVTTHRDVGITVSPNKNKVQTKVPILLISTMTVQNIEKATKFTKNNNANVTILSTRKENPKEMNPAMKEQNIKKSTSLTTESIENPNSILTASFTGKEHITSGTSESSSLINMKKTTDSSTSQNKKISNIFKTTTIEGLNNYIKLTTNTTKNSNLRMITRLLTKDNPVTLKMNDDMIYNMVNQYPKKLTSSVASHVTNKLQIINKQPHWKQTITEKAINSVINLAQYKTIPRAEEVPFTNNSKIGFIGSITDCSITTSIITHRSTQIPKTQNEIYLIPSKLVENFTISSPKPHTGILESSTSSIEQEVEKKSKSNITEPIEFSSRHYDVNNDMIATSAFLIHINHSESNHSTTYVRGNPIRHQFQMKNNISNNIETIIRFTPSNVLETTTIKNKTANFSKKSSTSAGSTSSNVQEIEETTKMTITKPLSFSTNHYNIENHATVTPVFLLQSNMSKSNHSTTNVTETSIQYTVVPMSYISSNIKPSITLSTNLVTETTQLKSNIANISTGSNITKVPEPVSLFTSHDEIRNQTIVTPIILMQTNHSDLTRSTTHARDNPIQYTETPMNYNRLNISSNIGASTRYTPSQVLETTQIKNNTSNISTASSIGNLTYTDTSFNVDLVTMPTFIFPSTNSHKNAVLYAYYPTVKDAQQYLKESKNQNDFFVTKKPQDINAITVNTIQKAMSRVVPEINRIKTDRMAISTNITDEEDKMNDFKSTKNMKNDTASPVTFSTWKTTNNNFVNNIEVTKSDWTSTSRKTTKGKRLEKENKKNATAERIEKNIKVTYQHSNHTAHKITDLTKVHGYKFVNLETEIDSSSNKYLNKGNMFNTGFTPNIIEKNDTIHKYEIPYLNTNTDATHTDTIGNTFETHAKPYYVINEKIKRTMIENSNVHKNTQNDMNNVGRGGYNDQYENRYNKVTDWWLDDMYLKVRLPLPINSNPGMVFPRRQFGKMEEVADLGALFIDDLLDYKEMLDRGELPLERATSREKGQPLCMEQFYRLLGVCRIPEVGKDRLEFPPIRGNADEGEELVVAACRNYFYPIPVKATDRGRLTPGEIQAQLLHCMVDAAGAPPAPRVGLLTSMNRDHWARARETLIRDENNRTNFELISRALCILCLDEAGGDRADTDADTNAMLRAMHGAGTRYHSANRWFDKTVQLIISQDGTVGMCYEHSAAEGVAVVRLAERALARAEVSDRPAPPPALLPAPQAMKWNIPNDVHRTIEAAARDLDRAISDLDHRVYTYRGYGREFMKSCRTSPDVYIQLALQYAYYKMYGYLVTTYESASLRRFRNGRVDNIRSAHSAAHAWAAAMCTAETPPLNEASDDGQKKVSFNLYGEQKKLELFEEAARKQTEIMEANILGRGIDNHLLGLREMARETLGELPPVFTDATYKQMIEFKLSTSQVTTTTDGTFMGYGAVVPDGYGCSYNPKRDFVIFCISSFTSSSVTSTEAFRQSLEEALNSMQLMFQARKVET